VGRDLWEVGICDHTPGGRPFERRNMDIVSVKKTVRKEGHRLNISISEVRRRRQGWKARVTCGPCICAAHVRQREKERGGR